MTKQSSEKALDPDKSKRATSGTLVKIKGKSISSTSIDVKELNTLYYAQNKIMTGAKDEEAVDKLASDPSSLQQNSTLNKRDFLETADQSACDLRDWFLPQTS